MTRPVRSQRGYIGFPKGVLETMLALSIIGLLALAFALLGGLWWLFAHISVSVT